jgi:hypothetical protein
LVNLQGQEKESPPPQENDRKEKHRRNETKASRASRDTLHLCKHQEHPRVPPSCTHERDVFSWVSTSLSFPIRLFAAFLSSSLRLHVGAHKVKRPLKQESIESHKEKRGVRQGGEGRMLNAPCCWPIAFEPPTGQLGLSRLAAPKSVQHTENRGNVEVLTTR